MLNKVFPTKDSRWMCVWFTACGLLVIAIAFVVWGLNGFGHASPGFIAGGSALVLPWLTRVGIPIGSRVLDWIGEGLD